MEFTIKVAEDGRILAINTWNEKRKNVFNSKKELTGISTYYDTPKNLEKINKEIYDSILSRDDAPYLKWINSKIVEESEEEKKERENNLAVSKDVNEIKNLKDEVEKLSKYFVLSDIGKDLINK